MALSFSVGTNRLRRGSMAAVAAALAGAISGTMALLAVEQSCGAFIFDGGTAWDRSGGAGAVRVLAPATCAWMLETTVPWVTFTSATGTGNGFGFFEVAPLQSGNRSGQIMLAGTVPFPVLQAVVVNGAMVESPSFRHAEFDPVLAEVRTAYPPFDVNGWAFRHQAASGTGYDSVQIYVGDFSNQVLIGEATYGQGRTHLADRFGSQFLDAGFNLRIPGGPPPGSQQPFVWVRARNTETLQYEEVTAQPTRFGEVGLKVSLAQLRFAVVNTGGTASAVSAPQDVSIDGIGVDVNWTVTPNQPWITVSQNSGTGPSRISIGINHAALQLPPSGSFSGSIQVATPGMPQSPRVIQVDLEVYPAQTTEPAFGVFEAPANGATGLAGAILAAGWVLDDVGVTRVRLYRDPVPGEGSSQVYLVDGLLIAAARPDVRDAFPQYPSRDRAGWGVLILTNMLPNQGNGTFTLHAYADDAEGNVTLLGSKTFTSDNASSTAAFGTIDFPAPGQTVSGVITVFGWALINQPRTIIPEQVQIFIDARPIGYATYGAARPDIAALFPGLNNTNAASAHFTLDTRTLKNGVHSLSMNVRDSRLLFGSLGSRYFIVNNP
jgi:Viral BACON domain